MARVTHHWRPQAIEHILRGPDGGVVRDLIKRATRVEGAAKRNLNKPPRRIDTGLLRQSIHHVIVYRGSKPIALVGSNLHYARYVHDGTGIYGPFGRPIRPKRAKALRFTVRVTKRRKGKGTTYGVVYAKSVKGMKPNPYLQDALDAMRFRDAARRAR